MDVFQAKRMSCPKIALPQSQLHRVLKEYEGEALKIAKIAAEIEAEGYMKLTRIEELMEFAKRMG